MRIGLLASIGDMIDAFFPTMIASWRASGHTVSVAAGTPTDDSDSTLIRGLSRRPSLRLIRAGAELRRWVDERSLDVVVTNSATASAVVRSCGVAAPVVYFCHGLHWNTGQRASERLWRVVEAGMLARTAGVITINNDDRAWFSQRYPRSRMLRLPSGVGLDLGQYPASQPERADEVLRLVWIGEFSSRKRPNAAIDLALGLRSRGTQFELRMLGEGNLLDATRTRIRALGLEPQVTAPGRGSAAPELASAHALVHTATWEGLPRVMLEALAVGRRTYAFDVKGVRDIPGAVLVADGDCEALAERIERDWSSGELSAPANVQRETLDASHSADLILRFLQKTIVGDGRGTASASTAARESGIAADPGPHGGSR